MQQTFDDFVIPSDNFTSQNGSSEQAANRRIEQLVEQLQALNGPHGYRLRRIMLTNFWLYGYQEFDIPHGRLFLAGENASGKSTVLTAALPLALDGDLRPSRIDTFGGRERRIEYYVLGSAESGTPFQYERRTAYIALEFEWCDPASPPIAHDLRQRWENGEREKTRFLTIGISLVGNINASEHIRPLRFLITDGSRLGYDLHTLYETGSKHEKRAYDHARFKQQLEGHGIICESQADYERQVARYLFGFDDEKDFSKLINMLLILRRPNLSTELNFSKVDEYLKQSLRKIPTETTSRVIGTIERIDSIQSEIKQIQEAYNATEHLNSARQTLAQTGAQLAAWKYMSSHLAEDAAQSRVSKLQKDLRVANSDRTKAEARSTELQTEHYQVNGQIKALEASEGLQVATQLASVRERVREALAQLQLQQQNLDAAQQAIHERKESLNRQDRSFKASKAKNTSLLQDVSQVAAQDALWEVAAFQLEEALRYINTITIDAPAKPAIPIGVTSLLDVQAEERISWLRHLEALHQQREILDTRMRDVRTFETMRFHELDDARRRFQEVQYRAQTGQESITRTLEPFLAESEIPLDQPLPLDEALQSQNADMQDDEFLANKVVEHFVAVLRNYQHMVDMLEQELTTAAYIVQQRLNELRSLMGSKSLEISQVQALYEQKQSNPEFIPPQPEHHTLARAKLAQHGIVAMPLYALLDFVPGVASDSNEAGRIETMLEDAGLLNALIVAPSQVEAADALLAAENLSDCRLNIVAHENTGEENMNRWLRLDPALLALDKDHNATQWEAEVATILASIKYNPGSNTSKASATEPLPVLNSDATWKHGLLTGRAADGPATYIGEATRLRARQRELDILDAQRTALQEDLEQLRAQEANYEQLLAQTQQKQVQLRKVLSTSHIEESITELTQIKAIVLDARSKYQKARQQTQELRQSYNRLLAQLEQESRGMSQLVSDSKRVQNALIGMVRLKDQADSIQTQLTTLVSIWEEYQKGSVALENARLNQANVANLYERICSQVSQVRAEEAELQRIAEQADAEELSERLSMLRARVETLIPELKKVDADFVRGDERVAKTEETLAEAETILSSAQKDRSDKQAQLANTLIAYPVAELLELQVVATERGYQKVAQQLLGNAEQNDPDLYKERLEVANREAYNTLSRIFNSEQPILLEYGPNLDDQGNVTFLNENKSRPVELLELLGERIEMQQMLLNEQERQLFEDFLLQEVAEAVRTHIFESEDWVHEINDVLSNMPLIGEHYSLQWKPLAKYDPTKLGSQLAQHYKLLRKSAQTLTTEETETLMNAFRREIESVRRQQQERPDMNFMEALEQVFDYREWFHFDILVTPIGGQKLLLTDRVAGTRSGAEQLFALYVPLFAALGALYRSAVQGSPRLLALDEAFDKVSLVNTQRIIEFLVSQDFQWIMTGPQVSGIGAKIPASVRYLMIHEKGSPLATTSPSFWVDSQDIQEEWQNE